MSTSQFLCIENVREVTLCINFTLFSLAKCPEIRIELSKIVLTWRTLGGKNIRSVGMRLSGSRSIILVSACHHYHRAVKFFLSKPETPIPNITDPFLPQQ